MADSLFPVFDIPEIEDDEEHKYYPSVYFDFDKGDFLLDGAHRMVEAKGKEAYMQWCLKAICTERDACLAYSDEIGTEFEQMTDTPSIEQRESDIEDTITDALMVHPCTEYVSDFEFKHRGDSSEVTFVVKGYDYDEEELRTVVPWR